MTKNGFFTDSQLIKETYYKGLARASFAANSDLWVQLFTVCADKHLLLSLFLMPGHTKDDPNKKAKAPLWRKEWHVKGNDRADSKADTAVALHVVSRDKAAPLMAVLIVARLDSREAISSCLKETGTL